MDYNFLTKTPLFKGINEKEAEEVLKCLQTRQQNYKKNDIIFHAGKQVEAFGLVLYGSVTIENDDIWGNKSILDNIVAGQLFAETYACLSEEHLMVHVVALEDCSILFLNIKQLLNTCQTMCPYHSRLIYNLLSIMAQKNLNLTHKIFHTSPKSIRNRLLSYLSSQVIKEEKYQFEIPFNRQQLADYLNVDRSALSNELGKMKREGLIEYNKNTFFVKNTLDSK